MIFTSLGLLVLAGGLLIAGVARSSVALLTLSLAVTGVAGLVLVVGFSAARRLAAAGAAIGPPPPGSAPPGATYIAYVQAPPGAVPAGPYPPPNGAAAEPVVGYDRMTAEQVVRLIASGALSPVQLAALREYEAAHAARTTVLRRLDRAR